MSRDRFTFLLRRLKPFILELKVIQRHRQRDGQMDRQRERERERQMDTYRQADRQKTHGWIKGQTDRRINRLT